jgi:3-isopropylmalate dehydrogenase
MFEPVHGSAPKFAGRNVANPIGAIASAALMLETLGLDREAESIDRAIAAAVNAGECTADIGGALGTREAGGAIIQRLTPGGSRHN